MNKEHSSCIRSNLKIKIHVNMGVADLYASVEVSVKCHVSIPKIARYNVVMVIQSNASNSTVFYSCVSTLTGEGYTQTRRPSPGRMILQRSTQTRSPIPTTSTFDMVAFVNDN
jgi:hypothetical protein